ncbi:MAG: glycoside hydrolase family 3 C-terminal domain-containing protein [Cytophagaceae bacterium]|nr:glycoside hydrolase family 3 C-terminal domain-containing protein [Cytophagaceae bacterium]MDW8455398.1 glycoside hydrolase family 3 N-terminal domain-containing protein [Cytophagaceae bacterium]
MNRIFASLLLILLTLNFSCTKQNKYKKENKNVTSRSVGSFTDSFDPRVKELLSKMTLEEKVGQMTQINISNLLKDGYGSKDGEVHPDSLVKVVTQYKVGSILNAFPGAYSVDQWHALIKQIQDEALKSPNKIPVLYGIDAIHGATFTQGAVLFPHNIAIAASRNTTLAAHAAKITAKETRASAIRWNFDPVLDIGRQPLWARFPETYGEDPYIVKEMGVATIKAYQEDGLKSPTAVAACMKHYVGYSNPLTGKDRTPAYIDEIQLREYYLPQFKAAIDAGAATVMINSAEINGIPVHCNKYLLTDVLRNEFKFKGVAVSDWEDIIRLHTRHKVAATPREAVKMAVNAGIDMSMVPHEYSFYHHLIDLVKSKEVSEERINQAVGRILQLKLDLGLFDNPYGEEEAKKNFGLPEYKTVALEAAREAITLLKNETLKDNQPVLPLPKNKKVLIAGPTANSITALNGCWSYTWQGQDASRYPAYNTVVSAIKNKIGEKNVINISSPEFSDKSNYDVKTLTAKAKAADYIILCLGENAYAETPGSIWDLTLDAPQLNLAKAAYETKKPVILVLIEGRPRIIREIVPGAKAILQAYWPGSQGAEAIADVIFGDYNPSGKLPYTYPKYTGSIVMYDHKYSELEEELTPGTFTLTGYRCQWPFGYGLSYTTFEYSNLKIDKDTLRGTDKLTVTVDVQNTGSRDGKVAVELYSTDLYASITPSMKRLRKFTKIALKAGETQTVSFEIDKSDLAFVNAYKEWVTEDGDFKLWVDNLSVDFYYQNK